MKAINLNYIHSPDGKTKWEVDGKVLVKTSDGTRAIRTITRITNGRNGTIYVGYKNINGDKFEDAFSTDGYLRGGSTYNRTHCKPLTDAEVEEQKKAFRARKIARNMNAYDWQRKLSTKGLLELEVFFFEKYAIDIMNI